RLDEAPRGSLPALRIERRQVLEQSMRQRPSQEAMVAGETEGGGKIRFTVPRGCIGAGWCRLSGLVDVVRRKPGGGNRYDEVRFTGGGLVCPVRRRKRTRSEVSGMSRGFRLCGLRTHEAAYA